MTMPFKLGLTGSIGMGKSTTAAMFAAHSVPVWDADRAVHDLYAAGGAAVPSLAALFPGAVRNAAIDRAALKSLIAADPTVLPRIEAIVHPLVAADRAAFVAQATAPLIVLDIPLLFETGLQTDMDATLLVTAPPQVQRARVMARPGMTDATFALLLSRQMPDADKRARATHIVETLSLPLVESYVAALIALLTSRHA